VVVAIKTTELTYTIKLKIMQNNNINHVAQPLLQGSVSCRFSFWYLFGCRSIRIIVNLFSLSIEKELRLVVKWSNFIFYCSPFSKYQKKLLSKRLRLLWLRFLIPIYVFVGVALGLLLTWVVVYLSTMYKMK
jgi:hypothetical protein